VLRHGDAAIMIDAGTGVARGLERPEVLAGVEQLDIVLTHFHLDHVGGLAYLPALGLCPSTTVWGPGALLYDTPTHVLLDRVLHEPFHPVSLEDQEILVRDLPAREIELAGIRVNTRRQDRHSAPSLAFRFNDTLAWITDTAYDPDSARFAAGCSTLAHEAWFTSDAPRNPDVHSAAAEAAKTAADAGAEQLLLIHLPPFREGVDELLEEAAGIFEHTDVALDGAGLPVLTPPAVQPSAQ
jgi:ribonuclease BN (tRNA processing enzyme)